MVAVWQRKLAAFAFVLSAALGCQSRDSNSDLRNLIQPSPTPFTPESPYTLSGTIIESGAGGPVANVLVETTVGRTTLTNERGFYEFDRLGRTTVSFSKEGFEAPGPFQMAMGHPMTLDASLQRVIRAPANRVLTAVLFPNDPYFNVRGDESADNDGWVCGPPCKVVRVAVPLSGRLSARVTWQPPGSDFSLFLAQRIGAAAPRLAGARGASGDLTREMSVTGGTDALVYFGLIDVDFNPTMRKERLSMDVQFALTTSISP
jgi:hypothetical protein